MELRYHMPEAGEVFLVWGLDGWNVMPEAMRPAGTVLKDAVMHTPMAPEGDVFVARVQVPVGTTVDYGFLITETRSGGVVHVWEADGEQDYHTNVTQDGVLEVQTKLTLAQDGVPARSTDVSLVTWQIRYHMPEADEVFLVWGVDDWAVLPEEMRPYGTAVKDAVMHTPMIRQGDVFVVQVRVPSGAAIDYGFLIREKRDGTAVRFWEANDDKGYHTLATQHGVLEVQPALALTEGLALASGGGVPIVTQEIRYRIPEAREVFLVWGINGWNVVPEEVRPAGTEVEDAIMYTPMIRKGDAFVATVQVPAGVTIDYSFQITYARSGATVEIWDTNGDLKQDYHTAAVEGGVAEVNAHQSVLEQMTREGLAVKVPWPALCLTGFCLFLSVVAVRRRLIDLHVLKLVVILAVAANLRLNHITQPFIDAFSWRQASTAMMAENFFRANRNILYPEVNWNGPGPSYQGREFQTVTYTAALLYNVFGQQDWVGRSVAVVFGLWGVFALYQLVRRVWDKERALASAAVMAVLPGSVFIERSFLPDPAMVALVVTSLWMLVAYLQSGRMRYLILAGVFGAWGLLTKIPGLIVGLPMVYAALAISGRKGTLNWKKLAAIGFAVAVALLPVIAYYIWARHLSLTYPPYHFAGSKHWLWSGTIREWFDRKFFLPGLFWNLSSWLWTKPVIALVLFGLFLCPLAWRQAQESTCRQNPLSCSEKAPWLFHWWVVAGVVYYLIGARELVYNSWNFHIINPAAAALAGHAVVSIALFMTQALRSPAPPVTRAVILLIIAGFGQGALAMMYYPRKPWDATESHRMGLALRQIAQPDDLVVTVPNDIGEPVAVYYSRRRGWVFPPPWPGVGWDRFPEDDNQAIRLFEKLRTSGADWLGIVDGRRDELWKRHLTFIEHIERTCEFHSETSDFVIFRILNLEEMAKLMPPEEQTDVAVADFPLSTQEMRVHVPKAGEVFLVWGVNGWANMPEEMRPEGTVLKNGVMHTSMTRQADIFVARVQVPSGATVDYGFLITEKHDGTAIHLWEADGDQDYHAVAAQEGIVEVQTALTLEGEQTPLVVRGIELPLLVGLGAVLGLGTLFIRRRDAVPISLHTPRRRQRLTYLRDLLRELVARDMKLRYKRSILGVAWSLLNPLFQILVFVFLSRRVLSLDIPNYPSFVFTGVLAWNWFHTAVITTTSAITGGRELVGRPGFPTAILPVVTVTTNLLHFLLALPVLLLFLALGGGRLTGALLALPLVILLQFLLVLGLGYLVATVNVTFRDTQHLLAVVFRLLFFLTPVFYDATSVPARYQTLYRLNPMFHLIAAYRAVFIQGAPPDYRALLAMAAFSGGLLWLGHTVFTRASARFAEEL
jgi:ABC-type polysaccharide/polyol phosphate export permease